jgi:hypothetical protein
MLQKGFSLATRREAGMIDKGLKNFYNIYNKESFIPFSEAWQGELTAEG